MRQFISYSLTLLAIHLYLAPAPAFAQVATPAILSAKFDDQGKLQVKTSFEAIAGCYVTINGGLSRTKIETPIVGRQLTGTQAAAGRVTIKTVRRYFCKRRTLYVNAELVCLNDIIGSALSPSKAVAVPQSNLRQ